MKLDKIYVTLAAALALGLASCSKNEPATPTAEDANKAVISAADTAAKTADAAKAEAEKAADAAKGEAAKVEAAKADTAESATIQGFIDKAKSLVAEGKYADASTVLQQLAGKTLSAEQTTLVASLKEQIEKALAAKATENAAGTAGNLLKK